MGKSEINNGKKRRKPAHIVWFGEIDETMIASAGGKGANLGELSRIKNISVPPGFCITTEVYKKIICKNKMLLKSIDKLNKLNANDRIAIRNLSAGIRRAIEDVTIPDRIALEITTQLKFFGEKAAFAVRSSATAEDLPTASFAGQQDTYLNIVGEISVLTHIRKCWGSLFSDRAVTYRLKNGFDHGDIMLSVIIQKMIFSEAAGVMFTADPVTSNRKILAIDAIFGLGEAFVSGLVNPDHYNVQEGKITCKKISDKKLAICPLKNDETSERLVIPHHQTNQVLSDTQILELEFIGRRIEDHFGCPQDIEWCLLNRRFYVLQSRPITTLYPIPKAIDQENHVYISVGHQQMMTDAMKPLGLDVWRLTSSRAMFDAGGRLFVDVAKDLASPKKRDIIINVLGKSDPLFSDAMTSILDRGDFIKVMPGEEIANLQKDSAGISFQTMHEYEPHVVNDLIKASQKSIDELKKSIKNNSGPALIGFILEDLKQLKQELSNPQSFGIIMTSMNASSWLNEKMEEWLGDKNTANKLSQSVANNVTSEMGLELLNVADIIRKYPEVIHYLKHTNKGNFLEDLAELEGGVHVRDTISMYLEKFGMRCSGEIDITKSRWSETPLTLVSTILSNVKNFEPGAGIRKFEQGLIDARKKEQELLGRLKKSANGKEKASETKRVIALLRNFAGYREYPKYSIVSRYFIYKLAILKEAEVLFENGVIQNKEDVYFLNLEELRNVLTTGFANQQLIRKRKDAYKIYQKLTPPRVITSDGEVLTGKYKRKNLPEGAIIGLPVSSGVAEGRARVITNIEDASLEEGDILVTVFTDPSWTPLFVAIKALVTEVGGLMTHGAVIAREYGLPAVVGVENVTKHIKDGQRIRVNGTAGYIEPID